MGVRKNILSAGKFVRDHFLYGSHEKLVQQWLARKGDITLRLDYDFLTTDGLAFDLGGYRGQWTSDIYAKYGCNIYVFEPVAEYADFIRKRFHRNKKIKVFPFGLSNRAEEKLIKISEDASSTYSKDADTPIHLEDFVAFVKREGISEIDLMKVNIEGGEYDILPYLISSGYMARIRAIQVQFHKFSKDDKQRADAIRRDLEKTHLSEYSYDFVWEGWAKRLVPGDPLGARYL
jgi:FkbM family methyltransferase